MITDARVMVAAVIGWWVLLGVLVVVGPRVAAWHRRGVARVRAAERRRLIADRAADRELSLSDAEAELLWQYVMTTDGVTRVPAPRRTRR